MMVSGGTISAKVEGSTDSERGMLYIFKEARKVFLYRKPKLIWFIDIFKMYATFFEGVSARRTRFAMIISPCKCVHILAFTSTCSMHGIGMDGRSGPPAEG